MAATAKPLPAELIEAYLATRYRVELAGRAVTLRIGRHSPALARLHRRYVVRCSAFVTACNPRSRLMPRSINAAAMRRLESELRGLGLRFVRGRAVDPSGAWPDEPSLLVLGLDRRRSTALARRWRQNALLHAGPSATPRLAMTAAGSRRP